MRNLCEPIQNGSIMGNIDRSATKKLPEYLIWMFQIKKCAKSCLKLMFTCCEGRRFGMTRCEGE
ncbi:MAG: hypothetical protein B7X55_00480 [Rhodobacterales bacterium 34-62-10]|nr:MAG: hypothetical protein B7X55_00480 [Rhodobacterales bacterium 34-62-10]